MLRALAMTMGYKVNAMDDVRRKIMLVDDDQSCRQQGRAILKDLYEVYPLPSANKLFELLEKLIPDLILLDINMPGIDGFEAIKRLKGDERFSKIPVIFLTATKDKEHVIMSGALGAAGFITKPFKATDLTDHIDKCFNPSSGEDDSPVDEEVKDDRPVVLAVDDAPDILKAVHSMLHDKYKVFTLPKPEKLKSFLSKTTPDLFLLDYQMPEINGFDLIPIIREFPEHKDTPIIFLTSEGTAEHLTVAVDLGVSDFIVKPFEMNVLRQKVAKSIRR